MSPRRYGTGGLYQRKSDGRWIGSIPDGHGGRAKYVTGTNREDVEHRLGKLDRSTTSPRRPSTESLAEYLERWLDEAAPARLAPRTLKGYRTLVARHIRPRIGTIRLVDLEAPDVQRCVNAVLRSGRSAGTAKHVHKVLRTALAQAVRWELVPVNVARLVDMPTVRRQPVHPLSIDQARAFLESVQGDEREAFYVLAITTGMRRGELLALRWEDVDLDRAQVSVNATLRQASRWRWHRDPCKTERSQRVLPLTRVAVEALRKHLARATTPGFVFARPDGRPWPPSEVTRIFQLRLTAAGLPHARLHDLRHTAAALMLDETGGDIRSVMSTLGHSSITTTVDIYGGMADAAKARAAEAMDRVFDRRSVDKSADTKAG